MPRVRDGHVQDAREDRARKENGGRAAGTRTFCRRLDVVGLSHSPGQSRFPPMSGSGALLKASHNSTSSEILPHKESIRPKLDLEGTRLQRLIGPGNHRPTKVFSNRPVIRIPAAGTPHPNDRVDLKDRQLLCRPLNDRATATAPHRVKHGPEHRDRLGRGPWIPQEVFDGPSLAKARKGRGWIAHASVNSGLNAGTNLAR